MDISIIVPIYNSADYLQYCLESISRQTYKEFEVLLIDDGSTDSSSVIADSFVSLDSRFKVVHKKNEGVSVARNIGLSMAQGEYVTMVDSDDTLADNYIEELYHACTKFNVDVAICNKICLVREGQCVDCLSEDIGDGIVVSGVEVLNTCNNPRRIAYYAVGKMFARSAIEGLQYPSGIRLCEDAVFNVMFYSQPDIQAVFCSQAEYRYRMHLISASKSMSVDSIESKIEAYGKILEIAKKYQGSLFQKGASRDYTRSHLTLLLVLLQSKSNIGYDLKLLAQKTLELNSNFGNVLPLQSKMICKMITVFPRATKEVYVFLSHIKHAIKDICISKDYLKKGKT